MPLTLADFWAFHNLLYWLVSTVCKTARHSKSALLGLVLPLCEIDYTGRLSKKQANPAFLFSLAAAKLRPAPSSNLHTASIRIYIKFGWTFSNLVVLHTCYALGKTTISSSENQSFPDRLVFNADAFPV